MSSVLLLSLGMNVFAADQVQTRDREEIYFSQMMTYGERADYRAKMRGLQLSDNPPAGGKGMESGDGGRHGR